MATTRYFHSGGTASTSSNPWLNTPLHADQACIRTLTLYRAAATNAPIECHLQVVLLNENPPFAALSYVWGDPNKTQIIKVNGQRHGVTENLFEFLQHLRQSNKDVTLWADALCINQSDEAEKAHQIRLMGRVYSQCAAAHIWLGSFTRSWQQELADEGCQPCASMGREEIFRSNDKYLEYLRQFMIRGGTMPLHYASDSGLMADSSQYDFMQQALVMVEKAARLRHLYELPLFIVRTDERGSRYMPNPEWPLILDCLKWIQTRAWWSRVWTYQEAVLPRVSPQLHIGRYILSLNTYLEGMHTILGMRIIDGGQCCNLCDVLLDVSTARYQEFDHTKFMSVIDLRRQRKSIESDRSRVSFEEAVWSSQSRRATEVRDHVFGILGLLPDTLETSVMNLNALAGCGELFGTCSYMLYLHTQSLKGLRSAIGQRETKIANLPSWAVDISNDETLRLAHARQWDEYHACGNVNFRGDRSFCRLQQSELVVKGIRVGSVGPCVVLTQDAMDEVDNDESPGHYRSFLRLLDRWWDTYVSVAGPGTDTERRFWRTVLRDRDPMHDVRHERVRMTAANLGSMARWWREYKLTGDFTDDNNHLRRGELDHHVFRFNNICNGIRTYEFFSTEAGEPGLGPIETRSGDEIYALAACNALAVLRRIRGISGQNRFVFVGLCYVDGWMEGEVSQRGGRWDDVILR